MAHLPLLSPLERALFLKAQPYLAGLAPRAIAGLSEYTEERSFAKDAVLFAEGERPESVYFLSRGGVRTRYPNGHGFDFDAPSGIGLVEYLAMSENPPEVTATRETSALAIDAAELLQLIEDDFVLYQTFATGLSRALWEASRRIEPEHRSEPGLVAEPQGETFATLDLVHRIARARKMPFFDGSSLTVLTQLLRFQEPAHLGAGESLWKQGDPASSLVLLLDGSVETCDDDDDESRVRQPLGAVLGAWDVFGSGTRRESAAAIAPSRVLPIDRALFADVLEDHFEFAQTYLRKLCQRLTALRLPQGSEPLTPSRRATA